ncbi:MAG TPA: type IV pilus biogenesis/stability protein PilW [Gammaproteobacteria bacterium]|nr:type IV pilus biogenesis/stability protein PilW [Gammaproteobacteria bacterium]
MCLLRQLLGFLLAFTLVACAPGTNPRRAYPAAGEQTPASVNTQLAVEYMKKGMYEAALEKLNKAIRQDASYAPAHTTLAVLYERLGEPKKAEKHYRRAYRLDPANPGMLNNYGRMLCQQGKYAEADKMFNKALEDSLYRSPEKALTNAGLCAARADDLAKAETYFRAALEHNPQYPPALREMVRVSVRRKHWLAARAFLQRLQAVSSLGPEFLLLGVQIERQLGSREGEREYAGRLKNRYPDSEETASLLQREHGEDE